MAVLPLLKKSTSTTLQTSVPCPHAKILQTLLRLPHHSKDALSKTKTMLRNKFLFHSSLQQMGKTEKSRSKTQRPKRKSSKDHHKGHLSLSSVSELYFDKSFRSLKVLSSWDSHISVILQTISWEFNSSQSLRNIFLYNRKFLLWGFAVFCCILLYFGGILV